MGERIEAGRRKRDPRAERRERDAFLVLFHVHNISTADPALDLFDASLGRALAYDEQETLYLLQRLAEEGHLDRHRGGAVSITPQGVEYIEEGARKRRSVRFS